MPTEPRDERSQTTGAAPDDQSAALEPEAQSSQHPHGYTLADEELERLEAKSASGDVLDPIALYDPVGQSVEKVVLRVGIAVVAVLVAGILLAQIACKNIQLSGIPDFSATEASVETVERALNNGLTWGGNIVRFPGAYEAVYDQQSGQADVTVWVDSARTVEELAASAQTQAAALSMNLFRDAAVQSVVYRVYSPVDAETGEFSPSAGSDSMGLVLTITWVRDGGDQPSFSSTMTGFDPVATSMTAAKETERTGAA